jgi:tetratricopeptide (TPR) repeat protein
MMEGQQALELKERGNAAYKQSLFEESISLFSEAIKLDDQNSTFFCNRSMALAALGRWTDSLKDAKIAIKLNPLYVKAHCRLLKACIELNHMKEAKIMFMVSNKK